MEFYIKERQPNTFAPWTFVNVATVAAAKRAARRAQTFQGTQILVGERPRHGEEIVAVALTNRNDKWEDA